MQDTGFITLHRKLMENPIFANAGLLQLFVCLLFLAGFEDKRVEWNGKELVLNRGQFITGRFALAEKLRVNPNTVYKRLQTLSRMGIINIKSNNRFSLVTIVKYSQYQDKDKRGNTERNNQVTTKEQQSNTTNNGNNGTIKQYNTVVAADAALTTPLRRKEDFFENTENQEKVIVWLKEKGVDEIMARRELAKFIAYWTEPNSKGKMRYEGEKFFEVKRRLATWFSRATGTFKNKPSEGRTRKVIKLWI